MQNDVKCMKQKGKSFASQFKCRGLFASPKFAFACIIKKESWGKKAIVHFQNSESNFWNSTHLFHFY